MAFRAQGPGPNVGSTWKLPEIRDPLFGGLYIKVQNMSGSILGSLNSGKLPYIGPTPKPGFLTKSVFFVLNLQPGPST